MPWKNGAGTTLEVARADDATTARMLWRVSIADVVDDGPFSTFDGYRRIISVLDGDGMLLTVDNVRSRPLRRHDSFSFDGGAVTNCELLSGPIRDFNVIFASDRIVGRMRWAAVRGSEHVESMAETLLVYNAADAAVRVEPAADANAEADANAVAVSFEPGDCLRMDGGAGVRLLTSGAPQAVCAIIELSTHTNPLVE